jgi:O-antigen/teichoic acid export membrane protein
MTLRRTILANYLGAAAVALAPVLALPWYLAALGPKQFGLVGFIVMLQAVLGLLDAGMSQSLVREIAIRVGLNAAGKQSAAALLFGFERIYWLFGLCVGGLTYLGADSVAAQWLNLDGLPQAMGAQAVCGAALLFAVQFPGSVYRSLLVGAQAQIALNGLTAAGAFVRHAGGVLVVYCWPTLAAYLIWHVCTGFLETMVRGRLAWRTLDVKRATLQWDGREIEPVWRTVAWMSGATWLGALTVQMDKIVLSKMVGIEVFGYYSIAAALAVGVLQLIYPLVQAVLPRAIHLRSDRMKLHSLSIKLLGLIAMLVAFGAAIFVVFGKGILELWLRNPEVVQAVYPLLTILLVGSSLNAFYNVGYLNWLADKRTDRVFQVNALALLLSVAIIPPLVGWFGAIGAASGWLTINLIGFLLSLEWLKKKHGEENF